LQADKNIVVIVGLAAVMEDFIRNNLIRIGFVYTHILWTKLKPIFFFAWIPLLKRTDYYETLLFVQNESKICWLLIFKQRSGVAKAR